MMQRGGLGQHDGAPNIDRTEESSFRQAGMTRLRLAPSLAGPLYLSAARVALANDRFARRHRGHLLLRFEDLHEAAQTEPVMQELAWLGIEWHATQRQSDRRDAYQDAFERLKRDGLVYPCFESEEELRAKAEFRRRRGQSTVYDRAMLKLTETQRRNAEAGGKRPHWRFKLSGRVLDWRDMVQGRREAALATVSDPVVMQADGTPTSLFANIIDDIEDRISHLIAADEGAGNAAARIELYEVLGASLPRFAMLPPLEGAETRRGHLTVRALRSDGVEPAAIAACLGAGGDPAQFRLSDLSSQFDMARLLTANRSALAALPFAAVAERLPPGATEAFWLAVRGSLDLLKEARGWWDVVAGQIVPPVIEGEHDLLLRAADALPPEPWEESLYADWVAGLAAETGQPEAVLAEVLRLALTGEETGPDLAALLPLIGRARAAARLAIAAA